MYKRSFRLLSFLLTLVMLFYMLPATAWAEELTANSSVSASSQATNAEATIVEEIESGRTEYSKEFRLSNGLHMAAVYNEPVHYQENGQWKDINNTLKLSGGAYTNTAGVWNVSFPQQLGTNNAVTITKDGYTLSFFMSGQLRTPGNLEVMSGGAPGEVLTANTEPVIAETEPIPTETEPIPTETEPAPTETEPVPTETEPAPTETEPAPTETEPAPTETEPVPTETEPVPTETEPVPTEIEPAPTETEPAPTETEPAPTETEPAPTETEPAPTETEPIPRKPSLFPWKLCR